MPGWKVIFKVSFSYFPSYFSHPWRYGFAQKDSEFFSKIIAPYCMPACRLVCLPARLPDHLIFICVFMCAIVCNTPIFLFYSWLCHAHDCNVDTHANVPVLFLTLLYPLFVLCVPVTVLLSGLGISMVHGDVANKIEDILHPPAIERLQIKSREICKALQ